MKTAGKRYEYLDVLRGITLISMIAYHAMWDIVYIAGAKISWYGEMPGHLWQQSICWTFILLSGFCWSLGHRRWKRGCIVFGSGLLVTGVTLLFLPEQRVVFGVLTLLGTCMLLLIPLEKGLKRIPAVFGLILSFGLFLLTKNINRRMLGFGGLKILSLPDEWFDCGYVMTFLGFLDKDFYSTDYFSLLPWCFLFVTGYFGYRILDSRGVLQSGMLQKISCKPLAFIGKHSLLIYLLHQPVIYFLVMVYVLIK